MINTLTKAMNYPETWVVEFDYLDAKGKRTRRTVSPIRFFDSQRFLGLCLGREEPRQFYLNRIDNVRLKRACDILMPVPMQELESGMPEFQESLVDCLP